MTTIYLVNAGTDYEGHSTVKAFTDRSKAEELAEKCREIDKTLPLSLSLQASDEEWEEYSQKYDKWVVNHPAGYEHDYYAVEEVELV
jgi:hypothetical protein